MDKRYPVSIDLLTKEGKYKNDKNANKIIRPKKKDIYQSEGRAEVAILGKVRLFLVKFYKQKMEQKGLVWCFCCNFFSEGFCALFYHSRNNMVP